MLHLRILVNETENLRIVKDYCHPLFMLRRVENKSEIPGATGSVFRSCLSL